METQARPALLKIAEISARTGLSRSTLYREFNTESNPEGRLKIVHIGRAVRVREQDLADFINALAL